MAQKWKVHKFGGTSVLDASRYQNVFQILKNLKPQGPKAIVVSAMKGTTDDLLKTVDLAKAQNETYKSVLQKVHERHQTEIGKLLQGDLRDGLQE